MATFAITGATGFIGRHACLAAISTGHSVIAIGHLARPAISGATCLTWEESLLHSYPTAAICIHFAGSSTIHHFEKNFPQAEKEYQGMADEILARFAKIIFISSAAVYGMGRNYPLSETDTPQPESAYAELKLKLEEKFLSRQSWVARLSNVYGPGVSSATVLARLARGLFGSEEHVLVRAAADVRDYIYIDDVCQALLLLALSSCPKEIYNISCGLGTSVRDLYAVMKQTSGIEKPLIEETNADSTYLVLNPAKSQRTFGWKAKTSLEAGMRFTLKEFKS